MDIVVALVYPLYARAVSVAFIGYNESRGNFVDHVAYLLFVIADRRAYLADVFKRHTHIFQYRIYEYRARNAVIFTVYHISDVVHVTRYFRQLLSLFVVTEFVEYHISGARNVTYVP